MSLIGALTKAAKAGEAAKKTAPFYSAVDEALANIARPKGTGAEFFTELTKQAGVKKAELADRKLEQAFKAKGKITKEEAQQILKENPPPKLKEKVLDESMAMDEEDIRELVAQEMFGKPYSEVYNGGQRARISDEVYRRMDVDNGTIYGDYRTPGGENYREILLKLPVFNKTDARRIMELEANLRRGELPTNEMQELVELQAKKQSFGTPYYSSHWKEDPNVLAHMRVQDRKGPNGEKILHVEEIQSDWHQEGRKKGYRDPQQISEAKRAFDEYNKDAKERLRQIMLKEAEGEMSPERAVKYVNDFVDHYDSSGIASFLNEKPTFNDLYRASVEHEKSTKVPDAPFKKNWHELAMKRLLNYAADNGYDSIAITPGAEQAKRYDLSKQINTISWNKQSNGLYGIEADAVNGRPIIKKGLTEQELEDTVGKEVANRIVNGVGQFANDPLFDSGKLTRGRLENLDLQVGGEGMRGFYDQILPSYLNSFGKPYGAQMGAFDIPNPKPNKGINDLADLLRQRGITDEQYANLPQQERIQLLNEVKEANASQVIPLHNFPITPEMRESIKQKGLPLYQQIGIPTAGAGAASQIPEEPEEGMSGGGSVAKMAALAKLAKLREEMDPRAEAVKALIAKDENKYLRDVAPNSLTNAEIEAEIARMKARAEASQPEVKKADGGAINFDTAPDMSDGGRIIQGAPFKRGGKVNMTANRDTMFLELSNKKLKRK